MKVLLGFLLLFCCSFSAMSQVDLNGNPAPPSADTCLLDNLKFFNGTVCVPRVSCEPLNMFRDSATNTCVPWASCPEFFHLNSYTNACISTYCPPENPQCVPDNGFPCNPGEVRNIYTDICGPIVVPCPFPLVRDPVTGACVDDVVTCSAPQVRDPDTNTCVVSQTITCYAPQVPDWSTGTCVTPAISITDCAPGQQLDPTGTYCVNPSLIPTCSAGTTYDLAYNVCAPTCPAGTSLNSSHTLCVGSSGSGSGSGTYGSGTQPPPVDVLACVAPYVPDPTGTFCTNSIAPPPATSGVSYTTPPGTGTGYTGYGDGVVTINGADITGSSLSGICTAIKNLPNNTCYLVQPLYPDKCGCMRSDGSWGPPFIVSPAVAPIAVVNPVVGTINVYETGGLTSTRNVNFYESCVLYVVAYSALDPTGPYNPQALGFTCFPMRADGTSGVPGNIVLIPVPNDGASVPLQGAGPSVPRDTSPASESTLKGTKSILGDIKDLLEKALNVLGDLVGIPDTPFPTKNISVGSITPVAVGNAGSCPAPHELILGGKAYYHAYTTECNFANGIRPIILAFAWLMAAGILIGGFKNG